VRKLWTGLWFVVRRFRRIAGAPAYPHIVPAICTAIANGAGLLAARIQEFIGALPF